MSEYPIIECKKPIFLGENNAKSNFQLFLLSRSLNISGFKAKKKSSAQWMGNLSHHPFHF